MSGYADLNHPAFYKAETHLMSMMYDVVNPARMDEELGLDPHRGVMEPEFLKDAVKRDLEAVMACDGLALLPDWEKSKGARAELAVAQWLGKPAYLYPSMVELGKESMLDEAKRLTSNDRQKNYGHPKDNSSGLPILEYLPIQPQKYRSRDNQRGCGLDDGSFEDRARSE